MNWRSALSFWHDLTSGRWADKGERVALSGGTFEAADSAVGYLYQVRTALLWSLRRLKLESHFLVSIETLDDVVFEAAGARPAELLQNKHHRKSLGALTDASPDLWRTLRIWFEGYADQSIPATADLYLVTTGVAPNGTAAAHLRNDARDVVAARERLEATALSSSSQENARAYAAFRVASKPQQLAILDRVRIVDAAPSIGRLDDELRIEVYWATNREHQLSFLEHLEGWWLRRVIDHLTSRPRDRIGSVEIEAQFSDLRDQFKADALPIDMDLLEYALDDATRAAHKDSTFVRQLDLAKPGQARISAAIRDYYRAFEQRSRWLRDELVVGLDLHKYEKRLFEEWELYFAAMIDELGETASDEVMQKAARSVLRWAEHVSIPIRPNVTEPFVSRGSLHMLADDARIGWHPEFRARLARALQAKVVEP